MPTTNESIASKLTGRDIELQRFYKGAVTRVLNTLKDSEARIIERLLDAGEGLSRTRQEKLLRDIQAVIATAYRDAFGVMQLDLEGLAGIESEFISRTLATQIPVAVQTVTPPAAQVIAAATARPFQGKYLKDVYRELPEVAYRKIRDTIRLGYLEGQTTPQIIRAIRGTAIQGYKNGVFNKARRDMEATVKTALSHTANVARESVYKANEDVIKGVQWVSTLDGRTSAICMARDGIVYPPDKGPRPPAHWNCRSATIPILKSWKELGIDAKEIDEGTRASMNGQVPAGQNYDSWLRERDKKKPEFVDEVLGKGKAELFRNGMTVDKFVDKSGRELTLAELRKL
jgi:SPP1 gp7 family putative phage head morphogenesis protein